MTADDHRRKLRHHIFNLSSLTQDAESESDVGQGYDLSKFIFSNVLPPARLYFLTVSSHPPNNIHESGGDISHLDHHTWVHRKNHMKTE